MSRRIEKRDVRVVVYPDVRWLTSERRLARSEQIAESIAASIMRHVDDYSSVEVKWDTVEICNFCGYESVESERGQNPECCDGAVHEADTVEAA